MNKEYWAEWYKKEHYNKPTPFAKFAKQYIEHTDFICELGCGNGRDSYYFSKTNTIEAYDFAVTNEDAKSILFFKEELKDTLNISPLYDVVYSRFFLHCLTESEISDVLLWNQGLFIAEFRAKGDEPVLWTDHERHYISDNRLLGMLCAYGYEILYYKKGRDMAKFKNENPLVIRVVARRKK